MIKNSYNKDKVIGGIFGLIIGDAVGVPYEFYEPNKLPHVNSIDMIPPKYFKPSYENVPFGTYSDDSAQFLCILDSYIEYSGFNVKNIADKICSWYTDGLWAVDKIVFDIGNQTRQAIIQYMNGLSPLKCGFIFPDGKGNGSLMRALSIPLLHCGPDEEIIDYSHKQSMITHGHICNQICCAFYSLIAKNLLLSHSFESSYKKAVASLEKFYKNKPDYLYEFQNNILPENILTENGTGYVVDCLKSAFKAIKESSSYEETIKRSIAFGNDTDTTAAVAGGLAGVIYGFDNIPYKWYIQLRNKENILKIINEIEFIL